MKEITSDPETGRSQAGLWRHSLGMVVVVSAVWLACFLFPRVWVVTGIGEANRPFMDLYGLLAASDAAHAGVDPFLPNDFDPYHRPHVYTDWWLELARLGLGRSDTIWLGSMLLAVVLVTAVVLVGPHTRDTSMGLLLLLTSPALLLAVNRANSDLVVFVLISLGLLCFRNMHWPVRALGILLFATSAVLKYYPLVTLVALLDLRSRRELTAGLALYGLVLVLAWPGLEPGLKSAARFMPHPEWLYAFGAPVFLRNLGINATPGWLAPAVLLAVWAGWRAMVKIKEPLSDASPDLRSAEREFMCGAAMLVGLFFLGSSYVYKLVFAVWLLPWLWQEHLDTGETRWCRTTRRLLLIVAWLEGAMAVGLNLLVGPWSQPIAPGLLKLSLAFSQFLTWALVACLLRFLLIQLGRRVRALLSAARPALAGRS